MKNTHNLRVVKDAGRMTAVERIQEILSERRLKATVKTVEPEVRTVDDCVVYDGGKARPSTNTLMKRLLEAER